MGTRQFVVFMVNNEEFGLDIDKISSVEAIQDIVKIPNSPDYIEGVTDLRGKVHTIFNMRRWFNMPSTVFDDSIKIIITNTPGFFIGIIVDDVCEIFRSEDIDIKPVPKSISPSVGKFLRGVIRIGKRTIKLLDLEKILADNIAEEAAKQ